jgi:hypothetical protein
VSRGTVNLKLMVDVTFYLHNTRISELEKTLSNVALAAAGRGDLVKGTSAEVKTWGWKVVRVDKTRGTKR